MLVYINFAIDTRRAAGMLADGHALAEAIIDGAALRVRPITMTASVVIAGLLPIMWSSGTGSEVMRRIAAPMIGGMVTALVLSMFVVPVACLIVRRMSMRASETHGA
jgi:copper/silver efflux system protein